MAGVKISNDSVHWEFCGGFLVREDFVMTAAHCNGRIMTVIVGAHDATIHKPTTQFIPVLQSFPHPEFNGDTFHNDIMLLKLKNKAKLNIAVKPIALPQSKDLVKAKQVCSVAGWGDFDNGKFSKILREADLEVQENKLCSRIYLHYNDAIQLCVGNPRHPQTTRKGDSGGPLVCNGVAQGIISYGYNITSMGVYTRITSFVPWIARVMNAP
ncbi:mast cell protease 8-like [Orycteropus afer afer]|uniref:Mast cell protease 8-like n=1 Tax=Orycteropus afer afer TaxID=1230840 RepID=A0A8B7AIW8_ORYAF|nr:mast cell protease 8-like [Orycteropus afer afer]